MQAATVTSTIRLGDPRVALLEITSQLRESFAGTDGRCGPAPHPIPIPWAAVAMETAELAGAHADGAMLYLATPERIAKVRDRFRSAAETAGRSPDQKFTTGDGSTVTTPFMRDRVPMPRRFVRLDGADAVELAYEGDELAMWLVVPTDRDGLDAVDADADAGFGDTAERGTVDLAMPKWEQTLPPADLFDWLCPLGLCPGAGFDGIAQGIFLTAAVHGAKVIVDEKGTEAAAATALVFQDSGPPPADLTVVADRPFLWAITHNDTGALLFVGRLTHPNR